MGYFFLLDFVISFFVLISIHAPWWAWFLYAISALVGVVIWAMSDGGNGNGNTTNNTKQE